MPLTVDFLPFATNVGANVETQGNFAADPQTGLGWTALTVAASNKVNKLSRQSQFMAVVLANFISQQANVNVLDDGDWSSDVTELGTAIAAAAGSSTFVVKANNGSDFASPSATLLTLNGVPRTTQVNAGNGLTGGGALSSSVTLSVNPGNGLGFSGSALTVAHDGTLTFSGSNLSVVYGTSSGTAAQGNDSRIVNAVPNTRQVIAGTGLTGGGALSSDVTISVNRFIATFGGLVNSGTGSTPHGLGVTPRVTGRLLNTAGNLGYVAGQLVTCPLGVHGATFWADATNVYYAIDSSTISIQQTSGGSTTTITYADWELEIEAHA